MRFSSLFGRALRVTWQKTPRLGCAVCPLDRPITTPWYRVVPCRSTWVPRSRHGQPLCRWYGLCPRRLGRATAQATLCTGGIVYTESSTAFFGLSIRRVRWNRPLGGIGSQFGSLSAPGDFAWRYTSSNPSRLYCFLNTTPSLWRRGAITIRGHSPPDLHVSLTRPRGSCCAYEATQ